MNMKNLNILLITQEYSDISCGGSGIYAYELAKALAKFNINVHVLVPGEKTSKKRVDKNLTIHYFKTIQLPFVHMPTFYWQVWRNSKKLIKNQNISIIHSNNFIGYWTFSDLPMISTIHHSPISEIENFGYIQRMLNFIDIILEKKVIKKSQKIIVVSELIKKMLSQQYPYAKSKIIVIPDGIDPDRFKNVSKNKIKKFLGIKNELVIFNPGGARAKRKGTKYLIKALEMLPNDINYKCIISGKSREIGWKKELNNLIEKSSIKNKLILTGELDYSDIPAVYILSDIIVFASLFEGFGIPALEALAAKKPIIATITGNNNHVLKDGINGFLVKTKNSQEITKRIIDVINMISHKKNLNVNTYSIENIYTWRTVAKNTIKVYE